MLRSPLAGTTRTSDTEGPRRTPTGRRAGRARCGMAGPDVPETIRQALSKNSRSMSVNVGRGASVPRQRHGSRPQTSKNSIKRVRASSQARHLEDSERNAATTRSCFVRLLHRLGQMWANKRITPRRGAEVCTRGLKFLKPRQREL